MATLKIMDQTGHSTLDVNPADKVSVDEAMARFNELTKRGYTGAVKTGDGQFEKIRDYDPFKHEDVILKPQLVGG